MTKEQLKVRTKRFAIDVLNLAADFRPRSRSWLLRSQLVRAGTGVGANYRATCRAKSLADFVAKMATTEEECDESAYWLELLLECREMPGDRLAELLDEAGQLTAICAASAKTARARLQCERRPAKRR